MAAPEHTSGTWIRHRYPDHRGWTLGAIALVVGLWSLLAIAAFLDIFESGALWR